MNLILLVLKTKNLSRFLRPGSRLFHSVMIDEKERVFEKVVACVYER